MSDKNYHFFRETAIGLLILSLGVAASAYALSYTVNHATNPVGDLFFDFFPYIPLPWLLLNIPLITAALILVLVFADKRKAPLYFKTIGLLYCIRSVFMLLTHLALPPEHYVLSASHSLLYWWQVDSAQFFSGHTALPFLVALLEWHNPKIRWLFLIIATVEGVVVLLSRVHYSIDVAAAFFITYAIYALAMRWFQRDAEYAISD